MRNLYLLVAVLLALCNWDGSAALRGSPAVPTKDILAWTKLEIGAFFSFNMITMVPNISNTQYFCIGVGGDATWLPSPDTFSPDLLDLDQWLQTAVAMGAKYAVLTAQHCSGFSMWPTDIYDDTGFEYAYSTKYSSFRGGSYDVVKDFIAACAKYDIRPGIYYSLNQNFYLNAAKGLVLNTTLVPGQAKVTQDLYGKIVLAQMKELWTNYGELSEIWFDGGCSVPGTSTVISDLLLTLQPGAVFFNGCSKDNRNAIRWVGTEIGLPAYPIWSTSVSCGAGLGHPDSAYFCPAESDTTLQVNDQWFWRAGHPIRSLAVLQQVYYDTVGQNTNLLLNAPANSSGLIEASSFKRYEEFGQWVKDCFSRSVVTTQGSGYDLQLSGRGLEPVLLDHVLLSEDQSRGQLVLNFTVSAVLPNSTEKVLLHGESVGNKYIRQVEAVNASKVLLHVSGAVEEPTFLEFSVYNCNHTTTWSKRRKLV